MTWLVALADPPLQPSPDDARGALRRELLKPEYNDQNLLQRLLDAISRRIERTVDSASGTPSLTWFALTVIALALVAALVLLLSRARRSARQRTDDSAVLTGEAITAAELRARAERALADGRYNDAVIDGFRALALGQAERGHLDDAPGATAHEVAMLLGSSYPEQREALAAGADHFDVVRYGDRVATLEQATAVLAIDAGLRSSR